LKLNFKFKNFWFYSQTQLVDALVTRADEGRFKLAKVIGEVARTFDPVVSEWGNPVMET